MDLTFPLIAGLVRETLRAPRETARRLISLGLPVSALWIALALIAVVSAILAHLMFALIATRSGASAANLPAPVVTAMFQYAVLVMTILGVFHIGRLFGGKGRFEGAAVLVVWLQFILVCVQVAQLVAAVIVPPIADILSLAGVVLFLWLLTNFIAELHGFKSSGKVFASIIGVLFVAAFVLSIVLQVFVGGGPGAVR